jgi:NitT/TauT family transport system substrate-binding protein
MESCKKLISVLAGVLLLWTACSPRPEDGRPVVRIGHFPNVTHAHATLAHHGSRRGEGVFERHFGPGVRVEWYVFNAGPSAMEALLAGSIDLTYVGPNPAINAHVRSGGEDVRILAGATDGGAGLVVRADARIETAADLRGRRLATPQFGNTQDIACRAWLREQGFTVTQTGGEVTVLPTSNADQLSLIQAGELDGAWTIEPWLSRIEREAGGRLMVEEEDAVTTVLAASARFLRERPELARQALAAHRELTGRLRGDADAARRAIADEIAAETRQPVPIDLIEHCWDRMRFTDEVDVRALRRFLDAAREAGFLGSTPDISRLVEVRQ